MVQAQGNKGKLVAAAAVADALSKKIRHSFGVTDFFTYLCHQIINLLTMLDNERGLYIAHCSEGALSITGKMANRHGLIAGATGTGKTVTLQVMAETFCQAGVPCFMADMKGDLSGISQVGKMSDHSVGCTMKITITSGNE